MFPRLLSSTRQVLQPRLLSCSSATGMLMTAAVHMDSAAHGHRPSYSSSTSPPWFPAYDDYIRSSVPSPPTPATAAPPQSQLRPTSRRATKRRPRPSRKLPTTYIAADPASFRRMVHQVTGADHQPLPISISSPETLCRPALSRAAPVGTSGAMMLPTLDTSAFLLGVPSSVEAASAAAPALVQVQAAEAGGVGGGACNYNGSSFPTLESWDPLF